MNWLLVPQNPQEVWGPCYVVKIWKQKEMAKEWRNKLQNLQELTDQTRFYFNHQKRREDMKDVCSTAHAHVARESQDQMINAVF